MGANVFEITPVPFEHKAYGLYIESSTGFTIEDNTFETNKNSWYGIVVNNLGKGNNRLYRNQFNGFKIATLSMGQNGFLQTGLQFKCNEFSNSGETDIGIASGRVAYYQGFCSDNTSTPAGNQFLTLPAPPLGNIFTNAGVTEFTYYSHHPEPVTTPGLYAGVKIIPLNCANSPYPATPFDESASCPPTAVLSPSQLIADINTYNLLLQTRVSLLQNGDNQALINAIHQNKPPGQLKNVLLNASPYLSDRVLIAAIKEKPTPLPPGTLKEIVKPNSPVSDTVYSALSQLSPALPQGIMTDIQSVQIGESARSVIEKEVVYYQNLRDIAVNE